MTDAATETSAEADQEFDRPPADTKLIVAAWEKWTAGEELPGRTMADLKIGGLDLALQVLSEENEIAAALFAHWSGWDKGKATPEDTLAALTADGLDAFIGAFATAADD